MSLDRPHPRRGLLVPSLLALVGLVILIGLGIWQVERKAEKEALIEAITKQLDAPPTNLPPPETWERLDPRREEFRRVSFSVEFLHDQEALVYTSGSAFRPDVTGPGYWVFTPARLLGGSIVVVNRGFVPEGRQDPKGRAAGQTRGVVEVTGITRWPEPRGRFAPNDDPAHNVWFVRDQTAIASAKKWGPVAPFYVEEESPAAADGLPQAGPFRASLPNNHLQYALTWFGLAVVLLLVFAFWVRGYLREKP